MKAYFFVASLLAGCSLRGEDAPSGPQNLYTATPKPAQAVIAEKPPAVPVTPLPGPSVRPAVPVAPVVPTVSEYETLRERALNEGKPLIVWVGCKSRNVEGELSDCIHYRCDSFPDAAAMSVVIAKPIDGVLVRLADLDVCPSNADEIRRVLNPPKESNNQERNGDPIYRRTFFSSAGSC